MYVQGSEFAFEDDYQQKLAQITTISSEQNLGKLMFSAKISDLHRFLHEIAYTIQLWTHQNVLRLDGFYVRFFYFSYKLLTGTIGAGQLSGERNMLQETIRTQTQAFS